MNLTTPTKEEALKSAMAELDAVEKLLNEADIPVEDNDRIWTLAERVEWLISNWRYNLDAIQGSLLY